VSMQSKNLAWLLCHLSSGQCRRQRLRASGATSGRESADHRFRAASVDLLHPASQKYSVDSRFRGDVGGYGGDTIYQAGTGAGSTENEYAYVWETTPDDAGGRRLGYSDTMVPHHAQQHCPQKPPRGGAPYRQTSLAPSSEYETTTTPTVAAVGRPVGEQNFDDSKQGGQFA